MKGMYRYLTDKHVEYSFIKFPRVLIDDEKYADISIEAKILFALLLDRLCLSEINADRFTDENGEIYVIYTVEEIKEKMNCAQNKALRLLRQLEDKNLIYRRRTNGSRPAKIYIRRDFCTVLKQNLAKSQNRTLQSPKNELCKVSKQTAINTYNNKTDNNNTETIFNFQRTEDEIREQIEYDCIAGEDSRTIIDQIVMIMSDVFNGNSPTVRIGKEDIPRGIVIARFCRLNSEHIIYIVSGIRSNKTPIKNIRQYLVTLLYNTPATMDAEVEANFSNFRYMNGL